MSYSPKGKHVRIDPWHPEAVGICDYTGFVHMRKDLVKQMEWRGDALVWTGFYVGRDYLDKPNPQLRPPPIIGDPFPVHDPRPEHADLAPVPPPEVPKTPQEYLSELENFNWNQ